MTEKQSKMRQLMQKKQPCQEDFETIRLISNGAYGYVSLWQRSLSLLKRLGTVQPSVSSYFIALTSLDRWGLVTLSGK
jgi:hypothetical protein